METTDTNGRTLDLMRWKLSLPEVLAFGTTIAILTVWIMGTFQPKSDAQEMKADLIRVMNEQKQNQLVFKTSMDARMLQLEQNLVSIKGDVSWIRGRLEPKTN